MPESSRHHHTRDKDYSSRDRRDEGGREDRRAPDGNDRSRSHREKQRYADTQRDPRVYEATRYHSQGVPSYTETSSSYYDDSQPYHHALYNLRYITTSRGICQAMEFFLGLLLVICAGVNHSNSGRYRGNIKASLKNKMYINDDKIKLWSHVNNRNFVSIHVCPERTVIMCLFGVLGIIIFPVSAVLAIRAFIRVRKMKQRPTEDNNL
uniref:MARVEL domain-containing protein n=1 Tax=Sinocyclocheilus anshuiensis TaxID=1608454 RepID=A0A671PIL1_9TELE